jgi:hypothetical protein
MKLPSQRRETSPWSNKTSTALEKVHSLSQSVRPLCAGGCHAAVAAATTSAAATGPDSIKKTRNNRHQISISRPKLKSKAKYLPARTHSQRKAIIQHVSAFNQPASRE